MFVAAKAAHSLKLHALRGGLMETVLLLIEVCLIGLVAPDNLACWWNYVAINKLLPGLFEQL